MPTLHAPHLAQRISRLKPSLVREILRVTNRPGMISFAGGLPAADLMPALPFEAFSDLALYQYGATEGEAAFRSATAAWIGEAGLDVNETQVLPLAGSQQGLDLAAKLLIEPGTPMLTEAPTYLAALQVFELFGANIATVPLEADGPDLAALEAQLTRHKPACIYLIPSFQNPGAACYSQAKRRAIAELLDHHGTLLIEDEPYRALALDVEHPMTPICALLKRAPWIYLGSYSKILWPGWRLGFLAAREDLLAPLTNLKQASDLHTQRPAQMAVSHWLNSPRKETDLARLRAGYRVRRDAMQASLERHFGDIATWEKPRGGLFFWAQLNELEASRATVDKAVAAGVAFMPGEAFYPGDKAPKNAMRLNYSHSTPEQMERGLAILSRLLRGS